MSFTTIKLAGSRVIVRGTDAFGAVGETVLDSTEWDTLIEADRHQELHEDFDATVAAFFAPLTEAAAALEAAHTVINTDPAFYVLVDEGQEAVAGRPEQIIQLSLDTVILRLIDEGKSDRLVWVDKALEVLELGVTVPTSVPSFGEKEGEGETPESIISTDEPTA